MATVVIKKYGNRRLYDTSASRYINLDDIASMVRNGKDVRVVDAKPGEDLTRVTLTQIIVEDARAQPAGLPLELLRHLIVATDQVGREFVMWYLKSALKAYDKLHSALEGGLDEVRSAAQSPLDLMKEFLRSGTGARSGRSSRNPGNRARGAASNPRVKAKRRRRGH